MLDALIAILIFPVKFVSMPNSQYYWATYPAAALTGLFLLTLIRGRRLKWTVAKNLLWPIRLVRHASTGLDIKLFFVGCYYILAQALLVGGFTFLTVEASVRGLSAMFGAAPAPIAPSYAVTGATMLLVFLAVEFGYWLSHWLMHTIPALWEFHKVHHSAEVLTPLTEWRQHPLELALFPCLIGLASSLVQGPVIWYFGASAQIVTPISANLISMAFWYTSVHLRHTELPIYATGLLGKLIQTPGHHQVHHSTDPRHFNKNLGYCLSIWDWAFGTLCLPVKGEKLSYGLGHKDTALETVLGSLFAPFGRAAGILARAAKVLTSKSVEPETPAPSGNVTG
jgi:sterol desaturase/sphingolipid hydroxylase (fatty acid hydroxylase superfamily)